MNDLQIFKSEQFGQVRILEEDGKLLFCAKDVALALGYSVPRKAIHDHCKGVLKRNTLTNGGMQELAFIPEGDVFRLIVRSRLPAAQEFERWVFDEVLPSLRRDGFYVPDKDLQALLKSIAKLENLQDMLDVVTRRHVYYETATSISRRTYRQNKAERDSYRKMKSDLEEIIREQIQEISAQRQNLEKLGQPAPESLP